MTKALLRVSTDKQSNENQEYKVLKYAASHNFKIDEFVCIEMSATKKQTKDKVLETIQSLKKGDTLITTELSRLGRNAEELAANRKILLDNEVNIIFTNQEFLNTGGNKALDFLIFSIFSSMAQMEREQIAERTKQALDAKRKAAADAGIELKLGHNRKFLKSKYDIYSDEICELRLKDMSFQKICNLLDKDKSKKWTKQTLCTWFNKRYTIKDNTIVLNSDFEQHLLEAAAKV